MLLSNTNNCLIIRFCCYRFVGVHQENECRGHTKTKLSMSVLQATRMLLAACNSRKNSLHQSKVGHQMEVLGSRQSYISPAEDVMRKKSLGVRG